MPFMQIPMPTESTNPYAWFLVIALGAIVFIFKLYNDGQNKRAEVLEKQIAAGEKREMALILDNKEQAVVIGKLGVSVDKLTEQGGQTIRLLEDVVYGRESSQRHRGT